MTTDLARYLADVPERTVERLRAGRRVLAITHENPDADTIGATLAVCRITEALGGQATPVSSDPIPELYDFLPGVERFRADPVPDAGYDLLVISDGPVNRIGGIIERHGPLLERLPRVVIDHHASNANLGPDDWNEPGSAATCEMVALLAVRMGLPLDLDDGALATALMAGIVMDTATFNHPNTTPRTLRVAAALVEAGAPLADISRRIYRTKPDRQLRLLGRVLDRLRASHDGQIVWSTLDGRDHEETSAAPAESEGIIDLLAQAEAAEIAILFKEAGPSTRISVLTRPGGVDATVLTGRFGGGGHARAAGATVPLPLAEAQRPVLDEAERLLADLDR
jgi:bifunctional oligoribonuclease and PAP phosphatase NrnA